MFKRSTPQPEPLAIHALEQGQLPQLSEAEFIAQHFSNDWKSMVEILSSNTEAGNGGCSMSLSNMHQIRAGKSWDQLSIWYWTLAQ